MKAKAKKRGRKKTAKKKSKRRVGASKKRATKKRASKKRATKKRAGKKKAAKKKTTKKKTVKSKAKNTINIKNSKPKKFSQHLKMNKTTNKPQSVHWHSQDGYYTLTFTGMWPFQETADILPNTINVPAGGNSNEFTADTNGINNHQYKYVVNPPPKHTGKKPNPDVILDD